MRIFLTLLLALFMTVGPVASLSAQIAADFVQEENPHAQIMMDEDSNHDCCDKDCSCSYPNQCDIQQLSFFAIKPQLSLSPLAETPLSIAFYPPFIDKPSANGIYRPPIVNL